MLSRLQALRSDGRSETEEFGLMQHPFSLQEHDITVLDVRRNLPPSRLYEEAIRHESEARIADSGTLVAYSGLKTGRSPKDKRIVRNSKSENDVWWGPVNVPL